MAKRAESNRAKVAPVPRELYLPEVGPPKTEVRRPSHVPPIPPDMYLTETGRPKGTEKQ
jgi:hypothetical protein